MEQSMDKALIINADKQVTHGFVVQIMDLARQNGVQKLIIATEQK
jgi:biopolymer transport protein ExbD